MRRIIITAAMLMICTVFAGVVEHTYIFDPKQIGFEKSGEGYDVLRLANTMNTAPAGEPSLPYQAVSLLLPQGEKAERIELELSDRITLEGRYDIHPMQHSQPYSKGGSGIFVKNGDIYNSNSVYPSVRSGVLSTHYLHGHSFALTSFTPAEYTPATGELAVYEKVKVKIFTSHDTKASSALSNLKPSAEIKNFDQNVGKLIASYDYRSPKSAQYDYLMITGNDYTDDLETLAGFYRSRGHKVNIVPLSKVYSEASGTDNPEKIRNYIISEYQNSGIEFVLIGGDTDVVPARGFYCQVQSSEVYTDDAIPSDLYFSALDGTWNDDGDMLWGEIGEDDLLTEVSVARLTFSSPAELSNMMNKIISYQSNPVTGELRDPLLVGEDLYDNPQTWGGDYMDLLIGMKTDNGYTTIGIPASHDITKMYDRDAEWYKSQLIAEMNLGHSFVHHDGHSNYTYNMRMYSSDVTDANFSSLDGVTHNFTNIYSSGCMSGGFDQECIGEKFIGISKLAVSYVGNSRYGWFNEGQTEGPSIHIHREFMDALYGGRTAEIGKAHRLSKTDTAPWVNAPGQWEEGALRWCFYDCNVLGDPAMNIWTDEPEQTALSHSGEVKYGDTQYSVTVTGTGGAVLSNIDCALFQNGAIIGSTKTASNGTAVIQLDGQYELGAAEIRASGLNTLLISEPVSFLPNDGKYITIDSYRITSGGDSVIEFGETASVSLTLRNAGLVNATAVYMDVTGTDEYIGLDANSVYIGDIGASDTLRVDNAFAFTVSASVPDAHDFVLAPRFYDGDESWNNSMELTAARPVPEIQSVAVYEPGDNIIDPGENGEIIVYLTNTGGGKMNGISASLGTEDPRITISSPAQTLGTVNPAEVAELRYSISAADIRAGYSSELVFSLNAENGLTFTESFYVEIGSQREDFETGDFSNYPWSFEGAKEWTIESSVVYQGSYSARSGAITHGQNTSMVLSCEVVNAGDVSFYYRTSSESNYDALVFYIDGVQKGRWSGISSEWKQALFSVEPGERVFKWTYLKDGSASAGEDCARLDNIFFPGLNLTSVEEEGNVPVSASLKQNYPNPFNPETVISYSLPRNGNVNISVFGVRGEKIAELAKGFEEKGEHKVLFSGEKLNSGVYFCRMTFEGKDAGMTRMLLIK